MRSLVRVLLMASFMALTATPTVTLGDPGPNPCERDPRYCR